LNDLQLVDGLLKGAWAALRPPGTRHRSHASFRRPQLCFLPDGSITRWTWRFNALMMPIRASIVGPPRSMS
jgi:hypothetical protein